MRDPRTVTKATCTGRRSPRFPVLLQPLWVDQPPISLSTGSVADSRQRSALSFLPSRDILPALEKTVTCLINCAISAETLQRGLLPRRPVIERIPIRPIDRIDVDRVVALEVFSQQAESLCLADVLRVAGTAPSRRTARDVSRGSPPRSASDCPAPTGRRCNPGAALTASCGFRQGLVLPDGCCYHGPCLAGRRRRSGPHPPEQLPS